MTVNPEPTESAPKKRAKQAGIGCLVLIVGCYVLFAMMGGDDAPSDQPETPAVADASSTPEPVESPTPEATEEPTPEPDFQGAADAIGVLLVAMNEEMQQEFFGDVQVTWDIPEHPRCAITVSDVWYALPDFQKERVLESIANICALQTAGAGLRGAEPDETNYPTTSFVDSFGKEVAYKSTLRTKIDADQ